MTDWKLLAKAQGGAIPEEQMERIAPVLDSLEKSFRALPERLAIDDEPPVVFDPGAVR